MLFVNDFELFAPFLSAVNSINELSTPLSLEKGSFGTRIAARDVFLNAFGMIVNSNSATIACKHWKMSMTEHKEIEFRADEITDGG